MCFFAPVYPCSILVAFLNLFECLKNVYYHSHFNDEYLQSIKHGINQSTVSAFYSHVWVNSCDQEVAWSLVLDECLLRLGWRVVNWDGAQFAGGVRGFASGSTLSSS
jgi:hypothetical protein